VASGQLSVKNDVGIEPMQPNAESLFQKIKRALDEEDVEGLLALGCPKDEYDSEAKLIEQKVRDLTDFGKDNLELADAARIVREVCNAQFGPFEGAEAEQRRPHYDAVARKIVS
jgi:hypothetical protein